MRGVWGARRRQGVVRLDVELGIGSSLVGNSLERSILRNEGL